MLKVVSINTIFKKDFSAVGSINKDVFTITDKQFESFHDWVEKTYGIKATLMAENPINIYWLMFDVEGEPWNHWDIVFTELV